MEIRSIAMQLVGGPLKVLWYFLLHSILFLTKTNRLESLRLSTEFSLNIWQTSFEDLGFGVELKLGKSNYTMDLYLNILYLKDYLLIDSDFLDVGWLQREDAQTMQIIFETSMDNVQGHTFINRLGNSA